MNRTARRCGPVIGLAVVLFFYGCRKPAATAPQIVIPIKVWVVLNTQASDVFDQAGSNDNQGCRLSRGQIESYIAALQNNRHIFGPNFSMTWDQQVNVVRTSAIPLCVPPLSCDRRTDISNALDDIRFVQDQWASGHVNVYFCGWMTPNVASNLMVAGATQDPSDSERAAIVINDRGWNNSSGASVVLSDHVLEHEMAHFLLRRQSTGQYDPGEHVPNGSQNILDSTPPHPLVLPTSEQEEARLRIQSGLWGQP